MGCLTHIGIKLQECIYPEQTIRSILSFCFGFFLIAVVLSKLIGDSQLLTTALVLFSTYVSKSAPECYIIQ